MRAGYPINPNHNAQSSRYIISCCSMRCNSPNLRPNAVGSHRIA